MAAVCGGPIGARLSRRSKSAASSGQAGRGSLWSYHRSSFEETEMQKTDSTPVVRTAVRSGGLATNHSQAAPAGTDRDRAAGPR
ncbi:hypothetical protein GCM10022255_105400 [Dactylosporangium darangshiense]|uniref:Uncharacterized protein n=1 Tax=Dactylosporangium darangshiense TaxID=579108 RepID=A0ABP8DTA5_9ACTN